MLNAAFPALDRCIILMNNTLPLSRRRARRFAGLLATSLGIRAVHDNQSRFTELSVMGLMGVHIC